MTRIETLTDAQIDQTLKFVDKWTRIGLCTEPADRPRAEAGVRLAYEADGLPPPKRIVWCGSPMAALLSRALLLSLSKTRRRDKDRKAVLAGLRQAPTKDLPELFFTSAAHAIEDLLNEGVSIDENDLLAKRWLDRLEHSLSKEQTRLEEGEQTGTEICKRIQEPILEVRDLVRSSIFRVADDRVRYIPSLDVRDRIAWEQTWSHVKVWTNWCILYGQHETHRSVCCDPLPPRMSTEERRLLSALQEVRKSAGWWLPHRDVCWISERHISLSHNSTMRIHCDGGPAIVYPDGFSVWALHGAVVPRWIAETPADQMDAYSVTNEKDIHHRREGMRKIGVERFLSKLNAKTLHSRPPVYELISLDLGRSDGSRPCRALVISEPGSRDAWRLEFVPNLCRTVDEALAFRCQ